MKLIVRRWGDGYENSGAETILQDDNGKVLNSVEFRDGEPKDFVIARDLNDAIRIHELVKVAFEAGKRGEDLSVEYVQTAEDEE